MSESKQSMQNTIKNLQARTENIQKLLEKGNKSIVIQIGSHSVKFGLANDKTPHKVRTIIAYKLKNRPEKPPKSQEEDIVENQEEYQKCMSELEQSLKTKGYVKVEARAYKGKPRTKIDVKMKMPEKPFKQISPLFDDHAFWAANSQDYTVRRPIKHGLFNLESHTIEQIRQDLENILLYCMIYKLKINQRDFPNYSVVLIVPEIFCRPHMKVLIDILMRNLRFKSMYLHLQSVLACFGAAVSSACVVDIGYQKINVCCVDEGIVIPGTVIRKNFGGRHINQVLMKLINTNALNNNNKKNIQLDAKNEWDMYQIQKLKQKACAINDLQDYSNRIYQVCPIRQGKEEVISFQHTQLLYMAPNCLFSKVWNHLPKPLYAECFDYNSATFELYEDIEDHFQEFCGGGDIYPASNQNPNYNVQMLEPFLYNEIEDMVAYSISNIRDSDFRKRMANSVLLIGGTAHTPKLLEELEDKLFERLAFYDNTIERVEIFDLVLKDIAPIYASWMGGTLIPKLDSLRDLWIQRNRFVGQFSKEQIQQEEEAFFEKRFFARKQRSQEWGMRYLKQQLPFQW